MKNRLFLALFLLIGQVSAAVCDPSACTNLDVFKACDVDYRAGVLGKEAFDYCMDTAWYGGVFKPSFWSLLTIGSGYCDDCSMDFTVWDYDSDCRLEGGSEVNTAYGWLQVNYGNAPGLSMGCLECLAKTVSSGSEAIAGCVVPTTTTTFAKTCTASCGPWEGVCDSERSCVTSVCGGYTEYRQVEYCSCSTSCGDGNCQENCGESCSTCASDCGACASPKCPNGEYQQGESKDCLLSNGCTGTMVRSCEGGVWSSWSDCLGTKKLCGDGSCGYTCVTPTTTPPIVPTSQPIGSTTTTLWSCLLGGDDCDPQTNWPAIALLSAAGLFVWSRRNKI